MEELVLAVFAFVFALCAFSWYSKRKKTMSYFESLGIPGPRPHLIRGNLGDILKKGILEWSREHVQKYGKVFGFYFGGQPTIFVADPEFMKKIQVKDFESFSQRDPILPGGIFPDQRMFESLPLLNGSKWRVTRTTLTPTFTMSKMNWMADDAVEPVGRLLEIIKGYSDKNAAFDIYPYFRRFTFDHWMRIIFGIKTNVLKKEDSEKIFEDTKQSVSYYYESINLLTAYFPEFRSVLLPLRNFQDTIYYWLNRPSNRGLIQTAKLFIKAREGNTSNYRKDVVRLMMDGRKTLKSIYQNQKKEDDFFKDHDYFTKHELFDLTDMATNSSLFHIAGFENVSILLAFAISFIVHHPEIQEKMKKEIDEVVERHGGTLNYDAAFELQYVDQVVFETLRLCPLVNIFTTRNAVKEYEYEGMKLEKGMAAFAAIEEMHRNPDYWEDPEKFDPDRFTPDKKPHIDLYVYQPFGIGPRHCVGQRIALMLGRLILGYLVKDYKFLPCEKTEPEDGPVDQKLFQIFPKTVYVKAVPWKSQ